MLFLETKYVQLLSHRLRNFRRKGNSTWNFSCPFCGDSERDKRKARGYIYLHKGDLVYKCHNCGVPKGIPELIKEIDESLYFEFRKEKLLERGIRQIDEKEIKFDKVEKLNLFAHNLDALHKISTIDPDHYAREYVKTRLIPEEKWSDLYFCPEFYAYTNTLLKDKFSEKALKFDKPRLFIPFRDKNSNMFAFQGRSFDKDEIKYITISLDNDAHTIYGMERLDMNKDVFVFEGPIDSMFIPNSIGVAGGDLVSKTENLKKDKLIAIYDNERRSITTIKKIQKAINHGYRVCIWPDKITSKDLNQMVIDGHSPDSLREIILNNTFSGPRAQLALNMWSRK